MKEASAGHLNLRLSTKLVYITFMYDHFIESPCASGPCRNGGRCHQLAASFRCRCRPGYKGNLCEIKGMMR